MFFFFTHKPWSLSKFFSAINQSEHSCCVLCSLSGEIRMKYGYFCCFFSLSATVRKFKEMISVQLFSMLQAISSRWARQAFCASRSSLCVWILMLWSSYRARNPTGTKTPVHNPESPPTTQQCRVTKHITNSLVLKRLHMQKKKKTWALGQSWLPVPRPYSTFIWGKWNANSVCWLWSGVNRSSD